MDTTAVQGSCRTHGDARRALTTNAGNLCFINIRHSRMSGGAEWFVVVVVVM